MSFKKPGAMSSAVGWEVFSPGILLGLPFGTSPRSCAASYSSARRPERSCERLVAQDSKGGERDGNLDDDRADRQEPDFALGLPIHASPVSGATRLRGHRRSPPLGCPQLLRRPSQLT